MPETPPKRRNKVFKSLHKPLTYMGIERGVFFIVCISAAATFNLFDSFLAAICVFLSGMAFGYWVTNTDPAFVRILARSGKFRRRYDAGKQALPLVEVR